MDAGELSPRTYRFAITVIVPPSDPGFDDPEWVADAASGALANIYGYECIFEDITELGESEAASSQGDVPRI